MSCVDMPCTHEVEGLPILVVHIIWAWAPTHTIVLAACIVSGAKDSLCELALEPCIRTLESSRISSITY